MTTYHASPLMLCYAPAKWFTTAADALEYARNTAKTFRIGYSVWEIQSGRPRRLKTFDPQHPLPVAVELTGEAPEQGAATLAVAG